MEKGLNFQPFDELKLNFNTFARSATLKQSIFIRYFLAVLKRKVLAYWELASVRKGVETTYLRFHGADVGSEGMGCLVWHVSR